MIKKMIERAVKTQTQQIIIDSRFRSSGTETDYIIDLKGVQDNVGGNAYSNVFYSNFNDVVGIKVLGVFIKATDTITALPADATAVDFICPQIPPMAQQLSGQYGYVWARVPLIRNYTAAAVSPSAILADQWWEAPPSKTQYFPPQRLTELSITLRPNTTAAPLPVYGDPTNNSNYLIVELTTLDRSQKYD